MSPDATTELAPAKINLALHVTGQRADGYHLMQTLVTFAAHGDRLTFTPEDSDRLTLSGRFGALLEAEDAGGNLVVRARDALRAAASLAGQTAPGVHIHLEKNLPVASGIGGGSADAAATLRGLSRLWGLALPDGQMQRIALALGADVPMCLASRPLMARGIGEEIEDLPHLPAFPLLLANPLKPVSTPEIFRRLTNKANPPLQPLAATENWLDIMAGSRNDLEPPARGLLGEIAVISAMLARQGATFVRMSGSGATCFGIFSDGAAAEQAAAALHAERPDWYFQATETITGARPCPD